MSAGIGVEHKKYLGRADLTGGWIDFEKREQGLVDPGSMWSFGVSYKMAHAPLDFIIRGGEENGRPHVITSVALNGNRLLDHIRGLVAKGSEEPATHSRTEEPPADEPPVPSADEPDDGLPDPDPPPPPPSDDGDIPSGGDLFGPSDTE